MATFLQQVAQALPGLSPAQKQVAEYALQQPQVFMQAAVADIAATVGVSEPTVIRLCRVLGCSGLPEFKLKLSGSLSQHQGTPFVHADLSRDDSYTTIAHKMVQNTQNALGRLPELWSEALLAECVQHLMAARRIEFYGLGNSGIVAQDAQHKFFRFGLNTIAYTDSHSQRMAASVLGEHDVAVLVSLSGQSEEILQVARLVKQSGACLLALTQTATPLAALADVVLPIPATEDNSQYIPMIARLCQLMAIDVLTTGLALAMPGASEQLSRTKKSINSYKQQH